MKAIKVEGNTYPKKRELRRLGGIWDKELKAWVIPFQEFETDFVLTEIEVNDDYFRPLTKEELRAYRQDKADRKADRLEARALSRDKEIDAIDKAVKPFLTDIAFVTQPITQNAGGRSFKRFRDKINAKQDKMFHLMNEKDELLEKADYVRGSVRVKGDAEAQRQSEREANDLFIKKGSRVYDFCFGEGTVLKVFKKSYQIKFDRGYTYSRDKSYIKVL